ncbi:MAG: hypothetical protein PHU71_05525, partial [Candidatus Gracilibacteria bacterium]|nr:hypothetical protein [Candidatus Gracilibacteria bacterium]
MGKNIINAKINIILKALVVIFAVFLIVYDFLDINLGKDKVTSQMLDMVITRFAGGICFLLIIYLSGYKILNPVKKPFFKSLIIILPCLAVAINNLPAIALLRGIAYLNTSAEKIVIFAVQGFCI